MKIFLILFLLTSCSGLQSSVPVENRKYDICVNESGRPTCDGFCYQDKVCKKRILGICIKREIEVVEKINMAIQEPVECERLFNMGFILQVREKPF